MDGIEGLINKIEKDAEQSTNKISQVQSLIQKVVAERKKKKLEWEKEDERLATEITELLQEISTLQGRQLAAGDLLQYLNK